MLEVVEATTETRMGHPMSVLTPDGLERVDSPFCYLTCRFYLSNAAVLEYESQISWNQAVASLSFRGRCHDESWIVDQSPLTWFPTQELELLQAARGENILLATLRTLELRDRMVGFKAHFAEAQKHILAHRPSNFGGRLEPGVLDKFTTEWLDSSAGKNLTQAADDVVGWSNTA